MFFIPSTANDPASTLSHQTTVFMISHPLQAWQHSPSIRHRTDCVYVITPSTLTSHPVLLDITPTFCVTSYEQCIILWVWCPQKVDLKSKSVDVMSCIMQTMPYIWRVWCHKKSGCDDVYTVGVMTEIVAVMSHARCLCCSHTGCGFIYRGCDVISRVVWWHKDWVWCYI